MSYYSYPKVLSLANLNPAKDLPPPTLDPGRDANPVRSSALPTRVRPASAHTISATPPSIPKPRIRHLIG